MHCPRCGQKQTSDEIRFCTKCGLAMGDVKEILVPELREVKEKNTIGKGVRQGLGLMLFGFVLITILAILRDLIALPQIYIKIAALVFCIGGTVRMAYPYIFGENASRETSSPEYDAETKALPDKNSAAKSLPPAQYHPPINFGTRNFDTAELTQTPSVTEHTTKRLIEVRSER